MTSNVYSKNSIEYIGSGQSMLAEECNILHEYIDTDIRIVYENKSRIYKAIKRGFDILASCFALIILSPILLATAIAIKHEDGGPVIFSAYRYGKDMKPFKMLKFRSMCVDAEEKLHDIIQEKDKNGLAFKIENDPRITKVGRFIRKTSIDELPQFVNIIKGEMSIVGPRPIETTDRPITDYEKQRWIVSPGLTCYWQTSGRFISWDEWIEMDLRYIENMSLTEDLKIIIQTIPVVIKGSGAR